MITVFSKEWFRKYNKQLCWLANSFIGDFIFKISKMGHDKKKYGKITEMRPNAITHKQRLLYNFEKKEFEQEYTTQLFSRNEYALRLQKVFYPIWLLFHSWDMLIANPFKPAWNLGFDTLTVYPDAGSGSTTVDGQVKRALVDEAWATIVAGAGTHVNTTAASDSIFYIRASTTSNQWAQLFRSIYTFDTSALTADATISAVVMSLYGTGKADALSITPNINVYTSTPASDNVLIAADFTQIGSTAQCDTVITYAGWNTAGYNDFTFNATGRGNVSKTSISKFGARNVNYDVNNSAPNWTSNLSAGLYAYFADQGSNKPKLVVTYTVPGNDYFKTCSEAITINDTLLNKTSKVFTEAISIIDSISIQKTLKRTLSETITIVDNIDAKKIATKILNEVISITDTIVKKAIKTFAEIITIVDSISIQKVLHRTLTEAITIVDSISSTKVVIRVFTEAITIVDIITKKTIKIFTETISIVGTFSRQLIKTKTLSEVITIVDTVKGRISKNLVETITIVDTVIRITAQVLSETITLTESLYMKLNGVNVKWLRKYVEKVGSFTRKYSEKTGTFIKKYFKDI